MIKQKPSVESPEAAQPPENSGNQENKPEKGGPKGPEPTRYGDWERGGKCVDF